MKHIYVVLFEFVLLTSVPLAAESVEGILMDKMCSGMVAKKGFDAAKSHTKDCALMDNCKASGYGVVTADGKFLKFDESGDQKAVKALQETNKKDNLNVNVEGKVEGDTIKVSNLKIT